jgi:small conductance mechanosensitive channel
LRQVLTDESEPLLILTASASFQPPIDNPTAVEHTILHTLEYAWRQDVLVMLQVRLPKVAVILFLLFLLWRAVRFFVNRMRRAAERAATAATPGSIARSAQIKTMAAIIRATSYSVLAFLAFLQILTLLNIEFGPLLASAGIVGVGIGLAAQSLFKDIINGIFILVEDQYNVGEVVKIASLTGTVEDLTLRLTRLRDGDGTLYIIPNSQVATVSNLSRDFSVGILNVTVDASANPDTVIATLSEIAGNLCEEKQFQPILMDKPSVLGVDKLDGRSVVYPVLLRVRPLKKDDVMRELRRRILIAFTEKGIPLGIDPNMLVRQVIQAKDATAPPSQQPLVGS